MNKLPLECIVPIFVAVGVDYTGILALVCKKWRHIVNTPWVRRHIGGERNAIVLAHCMASRTLHAFALHAAQYSNLQFACVAAAVGNVEFLQDAFDRGAPLLDFIAVKAANNNHTHAILCAKNNGVPLTLRVMGAAIHNKHPKTIMFLAANGCEWSAGAAEMAAHIGHHDTMLAVCSFASYKYPDVMYAAIRRGNLQTLKWLYENDCELDDNAVFMAIVKGDLECIKWLRQTGELLDAYCMQVAETYGHTHIVDFINQS